MSLLIVDSLKKHFGAHEVLAGASFRVENDEKLGVVGRNGGGKSTLLRIIEGLEAPDWGRVEIKKSARIGYVEQRKNFGDTETVREHVTLGLAHARKAVVRLETLADEMAHAAGEELERLSREHDRLTEHVERVGGWEIERHVETVLSGIGLSTSMWDREAKTLSGGEQSRVSLARALVGGHDLLLLDEPTNHLDLEGIEWLESYLADLRGSVLIVSHDRRLLTNVVSTILELEYGSLQRYAGNYPTYLRLKKERYDEALRAWELQQNLIRKEETFIKKHMGSQRTAEAKGRQKKLSHVERLERPHHDVRAPTIRAPASERGGEMVLETHGLAAGYGERVLFSDLDLRIGRGERLGIVGPNGMGKTTLLKVLAGRMLPLGGTVELGHKSICGFYDQETSEIDEDGTPFTQIRRAHPGMDDAAVRGHLARFLFRGNEVDKPNSALSGGERARIALAALTLTHPTWLALDEPTNHLDLAARTALEEMLGEFPGALVCVSHDREFLDGIAARIIEVKDGRTRQFDGNYSSWRNQRAAETQSAASMQERRPRPTPQAADRPKSGSGKIKNPYMFGKLEARIMELEGEREALEAASATEEVYRDPEALKSTQVRLAEIERELEQANEEWENWETA